MERKIQFPEKGAEREATPELTRGNRQSQLYEFAGELTSKSIPTTSHVVNGSNCRTQLLEEESRVVNVCIYTHIYIHAHIYIYTHICIYIYLYLYLYTHIYTSLCIHIYIYPRSKFPSHLLPDGNTMDPLPCGAPMSYTPCERAGSGFRVQGSGFRVQGSGFRIQGSGCRVQSSEFRAQG